MREVAALLTPAGQRLLADIGPYDDTATLSLGDRFRRLGYDPELVAAALTQARLRARGRTKFGDRAHRMYFTEAGLEQATRGVVAARHAERYVSAGVSELADLCCGIGADLVAFASAGLAVSGLDKDELTCAVARANVDALGLRDRATVRCAEVTAELNVTGTEGLFIDPARRAGGSRQFDPRAYSPPYDVVLQLADRVPATGAKLAPGIPHAALPAHAEAEWVSDGGNVVECALWFGPLAGNVRRRARLLPADATLTGDGQRRGEVGPVRRYLYEPDGAVIRAGLVAEAADVVQGNLIDPTIAYLTSDSYVASPFCSAYEVTDVVPFQLKRLRALLQAQRVGSLTIKKRGSAIEPEALRRQLRLNGEGSATIVLTRVAGRPYVLFVEPIAGRALL